MEIGQLYRDGGDYRQRAKDHLDQRYAFSQSSVAFKPTMAADQPFRNDEKGALSYFVAGDEDFSEDNGFALNPWAKVDFDNTGLKLDSDLALAMGHYVFTTLDGDETKVEYSFGYIRDDQGDLRIVLHHSSLPCKR